MKNNPVIWFEIYVDDMDRATHFYKNVFEVKLNKMDMPGIRMWGFPMEMNLVGAGGALVQMEGVKAGGNSTVVYFSCEDCAVEEARAAEHGGSVHKPKFAIGEYGYISLVIDSEGNMIGLHSMK